MNTSFPFAIVDPHIHQWDLLHTPRILTWPRRLLGWNPWLYRTVLQLGAKASDRDYVGRPDYVMWDYLPADYAADAAGLPIEQVVHVEAEWRDRSPLGPAGETRWLDQLFGPGQRPGLGAIVAYADLRRRDLAGLLQAHQNASGRLRGIRQMLAFDSDDGIMRFCNQPGLALDPDFRRGLALLQQYDLTFDAWVFHHQLGEMVQLARAFPAQTFILDHMGTPIGLGGPFASYGRSAAARDVILKTWQYGMLELAECPNVQVKLSGFFMPVVGWGFEHRPEPVSAQELLDAFAPHAHFVLQHFGVERCLFASNFPMDKVSLSLRQLYQLYADTVSGLSESDQRKLFADNARRLYRLA
ncbi:MAG: amidohydrolase family protein [Gammaproteobacteria bacterium]